MERKKQKNAAKWTTLVIAFLVIVLAVGGGVYASMNEIGPFAEKSVDISKVETTKQSEMMEEGTFKGVERVTETFESDRYPFEMTYPRIDGADAFNKTVTTYVNEMAQTYADAVIEQRLDDKTSKGHLVVDTEQIEGANDEWSFVMIALETIDDEQKQTIRAVQYDPSEGNDRIVPLSDVLVQNDETLETLKSKMKSVAALNEGIASTITDPKMSALNEATWDDFSNFALTTDTLTIYVSPSLLNSDANYTIAVPFNARELNDLFQEDYQLARMIDPNKKMVALTFDDGPDPKSTPIVLDTLDKYGAPGTFFMLGSNVQNYPDLTRDILERGHELGNHSWSHPLLPNLTPDAVRKEVGNTTAKIEEVTGQRPTVFRPPYGGVNDMVRGQLDGLPVIMWNVDTLDWQHRDGNKLLEIVKQQTTDRSIILMHDIHLSTAKGLDGVMDYLQKEGYQFVTISELNEFTEQQ
ncbi:MAG TPA: polysaccharide deacetylase family protein [Savagea sp.]